MASTFVSSIETFLNHNVESDNLREAVLDDCVDIFNNPHQGKFSWSFGSVKLEYNGENTVTLSVVNADPAHHDATLIAPLWITE